MKQKIIGAFLLLSLLVALTCGIAYSSIVRIDRSHTELLQNKAEIAQEAALTLASAEHQSSLLFSYLTDPAADKEKQLKESNQMLADGISRLQDRVDDGSKEQLQAIGEANQTFARLVTKVTDYVYSNKPELARSEALLWAVPLTETMVKNTQELRNTEIAQMEAQKAENAKMVAGVKQMFIAVGIGAILLAVGIGLLMSRAIVNPVREMVRLAGRIAACDLTGGDITAKGRDEIGQLAEALNIMKHNLQNILRQAEHSAELVASAAQTLSANSEQVSRSSEYITSISQNIVTGTIEQAQSVELSVEALESMAATMETITRSAQTTLQQSEQALDSATEGHEAVRSAETQMNAIYSKMSVISDSVRHLAERSNEIMRANSLIGQIAKQTNILSINASIEAARAGAEGRGFTVVAEEVRKLAGQTTSAAEEVARLMDRMKQEMAAVEASTSEGQQEAETGLQVVRSAAGALNRIHEASEASAESVSTAAGQTEQAALLSSSALEAVSAIREVALKAEDSAREVSACTEQQYAGMQEITSSAAMLLQMAAELRDTINRFKM